MGTLGVFRDDFYNLINVLPLGKLTTTSQASGVLVATSLVGATETYVSQSGATALTTDSAVNIIAALFNAIRANANGITTYPSQLNNLSYVLYVRNTNAGTLTLTGGTGVTISGTATLATTVERQFLVTFPSPTTVLLTDLGGSALT